MKMKSLFSICLRTLNRQEGTQVWSSPALGPHPHRSPGSGAPAPILEPRCRSETNGRLLRFWDRFSRCGVHNRSSCSVSDPRSPGVRRGAPEGAAQSGPDGDPRHAAPSRPAVGEPGDLHLRPGSTRLALAPSLPWHTPKAEDRPRPERTGPGGSGDLIPAHVSSSPAFLMMYSA